VRAHEKGWTGIGCSLFFSRGRTGIAGIDLTISAVFYLKKFSKS
jgi:hypothetical protein